MVTEVCNPYLKCVSHRNAMTGLGYSASTVGVLEVKYGN